MDEVHATSLSDKERLIPIDQSSKLRCYSKTDVKAFIKELKDYFKLPVYHNKIDELAGEKLL